MTPSVCVSTAQAIWISVGTSSINNKLVIASSGNNPAYFHSVNGGTGGSGNDGIVMGMGSATDAYFWNYESGKMVFATSAIERMRIDSAGRVFIGTTTEGEVTADDLTISTSGETGITIRSGTSNNGNIYFSDGTSGAAEYRGIVRYVHSSDALDFWSNAQHRMRIDSAGRLLVNTTVGTDTVNIVGSGGGINIARVSTGSPSVNEFLGAVGFKGYANNVGSSSSADARIHAVATANHSGTSAPSALIFSTKPSTTGPGSSPTERMRILSDGGLTFNGDTAQANALDDYEEGTFTPTFMINGSTTGVTYHQRAGAYIKVGHKVTIWGRVSLTNNGSSSGPSIFWRSSIYYC